MTQEPGDGAAGGPTSVERVGEGASLDAVAAAVGEGVFRLDADGRIETVSDAVVDAVGRGRDDLVGEPFAGIVAESDVEAVERTIRSLRDGVDGGNGDGQVEEVAASIPTNSGETVHVKLRMAAVDADGQFGGAAGVLREAPGDERPATADRDRPAREFALDEALDRVSDGFFAVDASGRFTYANDRAGELLERDPEALVGTDVVDELHGTEETPFVGEALRAIETGEQVTFEAFYPPVSRWFRVRLYPGETGVSVYFRDVTEERRRESALEQYETVVEAVDDGLYAVDEDYRFTLVNDAYCRMTGYDRDELLGEHISMVVDEETVEEATALRDALRLEDGDRPSGTVEVEIERADGERVPVESRYVLLRDEDAFRGTVGVVRDVSGRRAFEETLTTLHEASRELHAAETDDDVERVVMETVTGVLDLSAATLFRYDEAAHEMVPERRTAGAVDTDQELPPLPVDDSLTGHVLEAGEFRAYDDVRETAYVDDPVTGMRAGLFAPIGDDRVLVVSATEPGGFDERDERLVEILAENATTAIERHGRERELRESERRYRLLVDNFPNGAVALYDEGCHYVAVGGRMYDRLDLSPDDAVGKTVGERLSGEIAETLESLIGLAFEGESAEAEASYDGRDFRLQALPIRDEDGAVTLAMVVTQDVTERKAAQEALEESERRFRTVMEQSPLSTQIFDPDGNVVMVNPAWEELWGADSDALGDYNVLEDEQLAEKGIRSALERAFEGEATQLPAVHYDPAEIGKEGRPRWVEAFAYPVVDEAGEIREVVLIHNDVTESRERARELERYEQVVETVDDGVYVLDGDGRFVLVNESFAELTGHDREELIGADVTTVTTGEYSEAIEEEVRRLEEGEASVGTVETAILTAEGERVPVEARFSLFQLEEGTHGRVGTVRDVSERKERERAMVQSEQRYRALAEHIPNGAVGVFDRDLRFSIAEGQILSELEGLSPSEVEGRTPGEALPEATARGLEPAMRAALEGETRQFEVTFEDRTFEVWVTPLRDDVGDVFAGSILAMDVTERKERERRLERFERIVETVNDGVYATDGDGHFVFVNDAFVAMSEHSREELMGAHGSTFFGDRFVDTDEEEWHQLVEGERDSVEFETDIAGAGGETRVVSNRFVLLPLGEEVGRVGVTRDVTGRVERERALEESEARYRSLTDDVLDTSEVGTFILDSDFEVVWVNQATERYFGLDREEVVGRDKREVIEEQIAEIFEEPDRFADRVTATYDDNTYTEEFECHVLGDGDREERWLAHWSQPIESGLYAGGRIEHYTDITERVQRERELSRFERAVEASGHAIYMTDPDGRITYVNEAFEEITGYAAEEAVGETPHILHSGEHDDDYYRDLWETVRSGEVWAEEIVDRRKSGELYHAQQTIAPVTDENGEVDRFVAIQTDVTERKERERALEESEQRYRTMAENFPRGAVGLYDRDLRYTLVAGRAWDDMEGVSPEDLEGERAPEVLPPETADEVVPIFEAALEGETGFVESSLGGRTFEVWATPVRDDEGEVFAGLSLAIDVTEQREYERELERYERIVETVDDGVYVLDGDGDFVLVNQALVQMTDYDREELDGAHASKVFGERFDEIDEEMSRELRSGERDLADYEEEIYTAGGEAITVESRFTLFDVGDEVGRVGVVRDISERKAYERRLERFRTMIETVDDGVYTIDSEGHITMANAAYAEMVGYHREELIGMHASELVDESVHERARELEAELAQDSTTTARLTADLLTADGSTVTAEATFALLPGDDEDYERVAVVRDITERVERERELEQFEVLFKESTDVNAVLDEEGTFEYVTPSAEHVLGYEQEALVGESVFEFVHPDDREAVVEEFATVVEDPDYLGAAEFRFRHADGSWVVLEGRGRNFLDEPLIGGVVAYTRDVTELKERERELRDRVEQQTAGTELGKLALERHEVEEMFEQATDVVAETLDCDLCKLLELQPDGESLLLRAGVGWDDGLVGERTLGTEEDSIAGRTLQSEEAIVVDDIEAEDPDSRPKLLTDHGGRSGVSVIVGTPSDPWGVLGVYDTDLRAFSQQDVSFVQSVANILGIAIERASREAELRDRVEQEDVVTELGTLALEEPDLDRLFDRATDLVAETLDTDLCKLLELRPDGDTLALRAGYGWEEGLVGSTTLGTGDDSIAGRTLETEEAIVVDDLQAEDPADRPDLLTDHGGRSGVSVIVGTPRDPWGVLGTYDTDVKEFSQQDVNFVQSVANILGIAIERASREAELHRRVEQQQVVTDLGKRALSEVDLDRLFEEAVERVAETLDNEYAKVLELQPDGESLLLRAGVGWRDGLVGEGTVGTGDDSQAGHTIRSEEPIVVTDLTTEERFSGPPLLTDHGVVSGVSTVIGPFDDPWGVLGTHDTERREFSRQDVNFVQSVANILATAIDRRARERMIEDQRNRMAAIVRLSEIVQEVDQAVIRQSSREEIDRLVCEHLVESGEYGAAWIGDVDLSSERVTPRAVAGVPGELVEEQAFDSTVGDDQQGPTATAAASGEAGVARVGADADDPEATTPFPTFARERGYRSMTAVPLAFEDVRYGVLTLFSTREDAFEGYELTILEHLGRTVGHAINAIDRKQALVGDSFTELEIRLPDAMASLDLSGEPGGAEHTITVEGTVPAGGDNVVQFLTVTGLSPESFREAAAGMAAVEEIRHIGGDGTRDRYEVTYSDPPISSTLASYGGRIEAIALDVPDLRVTVALPSSADVRQIVSSLRAEFPDVKIDAQRTVTREGASAEEYRTAIEEALTDRQRTALMAAFFAGYFEWSRESTGEEVAETLGVSPSTFHQHLRAAQRKVFSTLFENEQPV